MTTGQVPLVLQAIEALKRGDRRGGAALLKRDLDQGAPSPDRCRTISRLAAEIGEIDMAIEASRRSLSPATLDKLLGHWALLATYGRADEAMAEIERIDPGVRDHPAVLHFCGTIASEQGRFEEAESYFRRAIVESPGPIASRFALAMIKTFTPNDPDLAAMQRLLEQSRTSPPDVRARLLYALGKAWDDCNEPERAFGYYERGAALRKPAHPYDARAEAAAVERTIRDFTEESLLRLVPSGEQVSRSLFVTGLPRSGTTLVQQILGAHSRVGGGEETNLFRPALIPTIDYSFEGGIAYQQRVSSTNPDPWGDIARDYAQFIDMRFRAPGLVADKTLGHTLLTGFLLHAIPDAKIVWLRRNPEDNALSCFRTYFTSPIEWSWSLADIASHFRAEDRLFEHWHALFADRILVVRYEELTSDPGRGIAALLAHFELAEEPGILDFHRNAGNVRTASVQQVRSPISTSRIGQARAYDKHLDEFRSIYAL
jgi:tetratricopeptide (TPR) repeat protein